MKKKLLNKKNLIIMALCLVLFLFPNISFADTVSISSVLKETIAAWYYIIKNICIVIMLIVLIVVGIKAAITDSVEDKSMLKEMLLYWLIGMIFLLVLEYFIYALIYLNEQILEQCKELGESLAEINEYASEDGEYDEITLYDSAISKAYELTFTSGTLGMIMYIVLLYYTIRFFFVYLKRYVNVMVLILTGPIAVTIYSFRKSFQKTAGPLGRWTKELVYNIFIQSLHALLYSTLIGLTIKFGADALSYIGAILTLIIFAAIFKLDGIIRKLFNFVGGKSVVQVRAYSNVVSHPIKTAKQEAGYITGQVQAMPRKIKETLTPSKDKAIRFKNRAVYEIKETAAALDGQRIKIGKETEKKVSMTKKVSKAVQDVTSTTFATGINAVQETRAFFRKEQKEQRDRLDQDNTIIKKLNHVLRLNNKRREIVAETVEGNGKNKNKLGFPDRNKATFIHDKTSSEETQELKESIDENGGDMATSVYASSLGIAAFIFSDVGSLYLGLSVLASTKKRERKEARKNKTKKTISKPQTNKPKKRYKIVRFGHKAVKTISKKLNEGLIICSNYLFTIHVFARKLSSGTKIKISGAYKKGVTELKQSSVKYRAKVKLNANDKEMAQLKLKGYTVDENDGNIYYIPVKLRKLNADMEVKRYHEKKQDSEWAVMGAISADIIGIQNQKQNKQLLKAIKSGEISIESLTYMGQAVKIDDSSYILLADDKDLINMSEEQKITSMVNVAIVDTVMKYNTTLEEMDITNPEIQDAIFNILVERGVISNEIPSNEESRVQFIQTITQNVENLMGDNKEEYQKLVIRRELANAIVDGTIDTQNIKENREETVNRFIQGVDKHTYTFRKAVEDAVKVELTELFTNLDYVANLASEQIEQTKEVYGFKGENKTTQIQENSYIEEKKKEFQDKVEKRKKDRKSNKDSKDNTILIFIHGAVVNPGEYILELGSRIRDAIVAAGGYTVNADFEYITANADLFLIEGQDVYIPTINLNELYESCRAIVEKVIKEYMVDNEIKIPETLRKVRHKNVIVSKLQRELKNKDINKGQIEFFVEERIKEIIKTREFLNAEKNPTVIDINAENTEETATEAVEEALRSFNSMSEQEDEDKSEEQQGEETLQALLEEFSEVREKLEVESSDPKQEKARRMIMDEINIGKENRHEN